MNSPKIPHDPDEIIAVVDENDNVIGETTRKDAHEKGLWHREVFIHLINSQKQVLLHKRVDNHLWDHSSSGHFPKDQSYEEAALREFEEELGIRLAPDEFKEILYEKFRKEKQNDINYAFVRMFIVRKDIPIEDFNIDKGEMEEIRYFDEQGLKQLLDDPGKIITNSLKKVLREHTIPRLTSPVEESQQ